MIDLPHIPPGKRVGGEPENEAEHYYQCPHCGQSVDMRDLADVFYHEEPDHKPKARE